MTSADRVRRLVERRGQVQNRDVATALRVSPATAHRLLQALVTGGILERIGKGPAARYGLRSFRRRYRRIGLDEHRVWDAMAADIARVRPLDPDAARSLAYATSEIVNNSSGCRRTARRDSAAEHASSRQPLARRRGGRATRTRELHPRH